MPMPCRTAEAILLLASCTPGQCNQGSLLLHRVKCRIGLAQEVFNRLAVLRVDGNSHADRNLWSVAVFGNALADALGYLLGFPRVGFRQDNGKLVPAEARRSIDCSATRAQDVG